MLSNILGTIFKGFGMLLLICIVLLIFWVLVVLCITRPWIGIPIALVVASWLIGSTLYMD